MQKPKEGFGRSRVHHYPVFTSYMRKSRALQPGHKLTTSDITSHSQWGPHAFCTAELKRQKLDMISFSGSSSKTHSIQYLELTSVIPNKHSPNEYSISSINLHQAPELESLVSIGSPLGNNRHFLAFFPLPLMISYRQV